MKELNLYYSAQRDYSKSMAEGKSHNRFMQAALKAPTRDDKLETVRTRCIIDEEWVLEIEKRLPFIEKAIREDRQFIRQEGETVPIEKAKKVSKASVSHLARHSDYITHLPEDENDPLLPDKIYITENESNYAIYENRFLYMLLCYTRDFVELRYTKISELGNTYRGHLRINKHIELGKRTITFEAVLNDVSKNDSLYEADHAMNEVIERLEAIRVQVSALLMTPLMNEVSKAPMLRPPVTRTNVLRMNNNFVNAVALYDYLSAYQGDGYTIEELKKKFAPFSDKMAAELIESIPALAFLVYKYGNDLEQELQNAYQAQIAAKALEQAEKEANRLKKLRENVQNGYANFDEYILSMNTYTENLEKSISLLQAEIQKNEAQIDRLKDEIKWQKEIEVRLREGMTDLQAQNSTLISDAEIEKKKHTEETDALKKQCEESVLETVRTWQERVHDMSASHKNEKRELEKKLSEIDTKNRECEEKNLALTARIHAYQGKFGDPSDQDLTEEENFKRLEKEREWFEQMFKKTWKQTKKRIRRDLLWKRKQEQLNEASEVQGSVTEEENKDHNEI